MFGKQRTSMGNLNRLYTHENDRNGNLGPLYFYNTYLTNRQFIPPIIPTPPIPQKIFDLTIFVILDNDKNLQNVQNDIKNIIANLVNQNKEINYNIYTTTNYNNGTIKNDKNTKNKILILDSLTNINMDNFINYQYYVYDSNNKNNFVFLNNFIYLVLFNIK
jgi:hypothetical protein